MKRIIGAALALAMLVSCNNNTAEPAVTTTGEESSAPTETTVMTTVEEETEETTADEGSFDIEELLAECTVYDVTTETLTEPLGKLMDMRDTDKPKKVALRVNDIDDLLFFMEYGLSEYNTHTYYITRIFSGTVEIVIPNQQFEYNYVGFNANHKGGTTIIENSNGHGTYGQYYVIRESKYFLIENSASESNVALYLNMAEDGEVTYKKIAAKYHVNNFEAFLMAYESDDDFYEEYGSVVFENEEAIFVPIEIVTVGNDDTWSIAINSFFEKYGVDSIGELAELYKQYVAEGREREFMGLE
ncbi:MAG: hypothetical protein E7578_07740 [Ruminococcaceae bacterium]|nr:hypothetical protein [Oscillospiraceae bacterium]